MPRGQVPEHYRDILESATHGHLATVDEHGQPQVNPVWFLWDPSSTGSIRTATWKSGVR
jgi:hypothetical protein